MKDQVSESVAKRTKRSDQMAKPGRLANSNWFITINTNQRFATYDEAKPLLLSLQKSIRDIFQNLSQYIEFRVEGHTWTPNFIDRVRVKQGVEFSEANHLAHVHFMIAIRHKSRIHLDYAKLQLTVRQALAKDCPANFTTASGEPKNIYFYSKVYRDAAANFENYINKDDSIRSLNLNVE